MTHNKTLFHVSLVFCLAFILRIPSFFVPFYNIDELTNGIFANFVLDGKLNLNYFLGNTYILTHYLYVFIFYFFGRYNLLALYIFQAVWVGLTASVLYLAGRELTQKNRGGFAAGLFYACFSLTFFSKDFQSALSESFSLLPASLAALFFIYAIYGKRVFTFSFLTGLLIGVSALFKAPSGIMIVPAALVLILYVPSWIRALSVLLGGLLLALLSPFFLSGHFFEALQIGISHVFNIKEGYIQAYENLGFVYWFFKWIIRSCLILLAALPLWFFAFRTIKEIFTGKDQFLRHEYYMTLFLVFWFFCDWFVVTLGKRVFFHYFIFLLPSLCLLASVSLARIEKLRFGFKQGQYGFIFLLGLLSVITFMSDGFLRWSLKNEASKNVIEEIKKTTSSQDTIYVWGLLPQYYFFAERQPASTQIWADSLAGFSTGSPAMEYIRSTGRSLTLPETIAKDLQASTSNNRLVNPVANGSQPAITDNELLTFHEILEYIEPAMWRDLFKDFFNDPPVLFLDTSPSGIRGFSHYPVEKYDLLKQFLTDNYVYEKTIDGVMFYRLK